MKQKMMSVLDRVTELLNKHPKLRDSDNKLVATLWWKHYGDESCRLSPMITLLTDMSKDKLPSFESISRCRRKLQEEFPHLRGESWEKRQNELQKNVKKELKSFKNVRKKIEKARLKRNEIRTPYPVGFEYKRNR